jgi:hypothetical protein
MPRHAIYFQIRLDPKTAAYASHAADRCGLPIADWIATVLRRQLHHDGDADAVAARIYEVAVASAHLLHALMLDAIGPEATAQALERATAAAEEASARELARAEEAES